MSMIFNERHDFETEDVKLLYSKFEDIKFSNIPEAWVILLDKFLENNFVYVKSVSQLYGLLHIDFISSKSKKLETDTLRLEKRLYMIDKDLHAEL